MLITETYRTREDGVNLIRTYSGRGMYIKKAGTDEIYDEAIDVEGSPFRYIELESKIEIEEETSITN